MKKTRALALCLVLAASPAFGQSAADIAMARDLFMEAAAAAREDKWEKARDLYGRSLSLKPSASTFYGLGLAQSKTGQYVEAIESYRSFLIDARPDDPYRDVAKAQMVALEPKVGKLEIAVASTAGLEVTLNGVVVPPAALGLARRVNPGKHVVVAKAQGLADTSREVEVAEGKTTRIELTLEPSTAGGPPPPPAKVEPPKRDYAIGGGVLAGGLAIFGVGLGVGVSGMVDARNVQFNPSPEADAARLKMNAGDVVAAVGLATGVVGIVLLVVEATKKPAPPPVAAMRLQGPRATLPFAVLW